MTDHTEINRQLARAIGWKELLVDLYGQLWVGEPGQPLTGLFDYRHPDVIWPIAERYNCFPYALKDKQGRLTGDWGAWSGTPYCHASDTAALAVAKAVTHKLKA